MGLSDRRRTLGGVRELPFDAQVEYIEAVENGEETFRIDTDFIPTGLDIDFAIGFVITRAKVPYAVLASNQHKNTMSDFYSLRKFTPSSADIQVNYSSDDMVYHSIYNVPDGLRHDFEVRGSDKNIVADDKVFNITFHTMANGSNNPFVLLNRYDFQRQMFAKIYYFKVKKAGVTFVDLIPVRVGDEGLMYDRVSGRMLGNQGTGKFAVGPDINM